jgi:hypothetical protein
MLQVAPSWKQFTHNMRTRHQKQSCNKEALQQPIIIVHQKTDNNRKKNKFELGKNIPFEVVEVNKS